MRSSGFLFAVVVGLAPGLALAWMPYGSGVGAPPYPGYAAPYGSAPYGAMPYGTMPYGMPSGATPNGAVPRGAFQPPQTGAAPGSAAPGPVAPMAPPAFGDGTPLARAERPRLDVVRGMDDAAYQIDIRLSGIAPSEVKVQPQGRGLVVVYKSERQQMRQDTLPGQMGYRQAYRRVSGNLTRRVALPADAKLEALTREDSADLIRIRIPRHAAYRAPLPQR